MTARVAVALIRAYQRWLSPHKGFCCAWAVASGRGSCSGVGLRGFRRAGWLGGCALLRRQLDRCTMAAQALRAQEGVYPRLRPAARQRGDCDYGGCDLPGNCADNIGCDVAECLADAPCDCGNRRDSAAEAARRRAEARRARRDSRRGARA